MLDFAQSTKLSLGLLIAASAANAGLGFVAATTKSTSAKASAIERYASTLRPSATAAARKLYNDCDR